MRGELTVVVLVVEAERGARVGSLRCEEEEAVMWDVMCAS